MLAGQTMVAGDGKEVCLFPFEYLYMSQDEGGDFSHQGTYNIDFLGWSASGRVYQCPFYAPVTLKCVDSWDYSGSHNLTYQSVGPVHLANGRVDILTIDFAHDDNPIHNVGDVILQGALLGHTGTFGQVTGDHTHSCCGMGVFQGYTDRGSSRYDLTNRIHYWDACFVNDTVIIEGYNHPWRTYDGPTPTPTDEKKGFPWVLYARKLRNKY